jgi:hypothetical protein
MFETPLFQLGWVFKLVQSKHFRAPRLLMSECVKSCFFSSYFFFSLVKKEERR